MTIVFPNSDSVGFQSLGPGSGATKMYAPKNRNSPGTLLEPCWNLAETFLEPCWNLAETFLEPCLQPCWNFAGTLLEPSWNRLSSYMLDNTVGLPVRHSDKCIREIREMMRNEMLELYQSAKPNE